MPTREKGKMTVGEAGRKGGAKVASERGSDFFSAIGHKGGAKVSADRGHMSEIGHKGGERVRELVEKGKRDGREG